MSTITVVRGDITQQLVDVVVNAANHRMRGGGGVDGAIHRAGGPEILADCIERFPDGLATGDAGYTTAGDLPAQWVVHTVGPNYSAGQQDPELLASCYRRSLAVADELGANSIAFPLISTGIYRWPLRHAVEIAVRTILEMPGTVEDIRFVAFDEETERVVRAELELNMLIHMFEGVRVLHERGYEQVRALPGMSPSGAYWRVAIAEARVLAGELDHTRREEAGPIIRYSTAGGMEFAETMVSVTTSPADFAELIATALGLEATEPDPEYRRWFSGLVALITDHAALPVAYSDAYEPKPGWEIGWGSGIRYPEPPGIRAGDG
ncbi:O-acetyl-ADP-ribose deacetylase [Microbacterium sp. NPDC058342]|uniref:O-acetyl-ADP-ribose deacetylase n=1 Tax=Microbacterium sp. NPDC058342 TaxID=3346454 RepID=UPI0036627F57